MGQLEQPRTLPEPAKQELLEAREAVWRAFFAHDQAALDKLIPEETITIDENGGEFGNRQAVMTGSEAFVKSGARLVKLEFPKTQIQCYGNTAVVYSTYLYELEKDGRRNPFSGRVTEVLCSGRGSGSISRRPPTRSSLGLRNALGSRLQNVGPRFLLKSIRS